MKPGQAEGADGAGRPVRVTGAMSKHYFTVTVLEVEGSHPDSA
jgi:hypothetical protein